MSGIKNGFSNIYSHVKKNVGRYAVAGAMIGALSTAPRAEGSIIPIYGYEDFLNSGEVQTVQSVGYPVDNMTWINPATGEEEVISGTWDLLFLRDAVGGGLEAIGGATNPYGNGGWEEGKGWLDGIYIHKNLDGSIAMENGDKPQYVWAFNDVNQDGYGSFNTDTGQWTRGSDDLFYDQNGIKFNDILGGVNEMPIYDGMGTAYLPHMIAVGQPVVPEPGTLLLLGSGIMSLAALGRKNFSKK